MRNFNFCVCFGQKFKKLNNLSRGITKILVFYMPTLIKTGLFVWWNNVRATVIRTD